MTEINVTLGEPEPTKGGPDSIEWSAPETTVVVDRGLLARIEAHTAEDTSLECGGVLLGRVDEADGLVAVLDAIRADGATRKADSLKFTHEVIADIHATRDRDFPSLHIVGWYHSHPGYGIFLSADDLFMHRNFFAAEYQVAYVVDPVQDDRGMFIWRGGDVVRTDAWGPFSAKGAAGDTTRALAAAAAAEIASRVTRPPAVVPPVTDAVPDSPERPLLPTPEPTTEPSPEPTTVVVNSGVRRSGVGDVAPRMLAAVAAALAIVFFGLGFVVARGTGDDGEVQMADAGAPSRTETTALRDDPTSTADVVATVAPSATTTVALPATTLPSSTVVPSGSVPGNQDQQEELDATTKLDDLVEADSSKVEQLVDNWVAQLGAAPSKSTAASTALAAYRKISEARDDVLLVQMSAYGYGGTPGWATIVNWRFSTAAEANDWCASKQFARTACFARRLEKGQNQAETVMRP